MKTCEECESVNPDDAQFCKNCGGQNFVYIKNTRISYLALASFISSLFFLSFIGSLLAIVMGRHAIDNINKSNGQLSGTTLAKVGITIGYIGLGIIVLTLLAIAIPKFIAVNSAVQ
jgi:hypothetical protein